MSKKVMTQKTTLLITGGAGFIGAHLVLRMVKKYPNYQIINYDALTYAADLTTLKSIENAPNYTFIKGDITDATAVNALFEKYPIDQVLHLAAESHVDNSISKPFQFAQTNVMGTLNLLEAARKSWQQQANGKRFYHISTDEVFGSLGATGTFKETTPYDPRSPYSASKAASDHFVRAYYHTYNLPIVLSNCSNNFGPNQYPEKLIPLFIHNIWKEKKLPVYGQGTNVRDWLYVEDHIAAIDLILHQGKTGETYTIGGAHELPNIDLVHQLISVTDRLLGRPQGSSLALIDYVTDRLGHDFRYAMDFTKLHHELGWSPQTPFDQALEKTVRATLDRLKNNNNENE
ncbi:MAG: dTDP-glucose 4,6-dehydratase [Bacteroidetes bacterium]|nr:dTDP-glucose 4,6-dehydratase [Bacteroidota bacterium]